MNSAPATKSGLRAVELFAGIGGFRLASDHAGMVTLWANDLSEKACTVYRSQFGQHEISCGDFGTLSDAVPEHDVLTAGFPCQPFSCAGKKQGIRDSRGTLFHHIIATLKSHRPRYFVLENVKPLLGMGNGRHFATILGCLAELDYFVEWRLLNACHFGLPQNRERVFIVGELTTHPDYRPHHASYCPMKLAQPQEFAGSCDTHTLLFARSSWRAISRHKRRFPTWGMAYRGRFTGSCLEAFSRASPAVTLASVLEPQVADDFDFTEATHEWLSRNKPVDRFRRGVEILSNQMGGARMGYTIFGVNGVAPTLTSTTSRHYERYKVGSRYRRLTNIEYARIQGFPDNHCMSLSVIDQYAAYGNAVPPPMAEWVLRQLGSDGVQSDDFPRHPRGRSLFGYRRLKESPTQDRQREPEPHQCPTRRVASVVPTR